MKNHDDLDRLFAQSRESPPEPRPAFLDELAKAAREEAARMDTPRKAAWQNANPWAVLQNALGGWPGLAGLTAAIAFGLVVGVHPNLAPSYAQDWLGTSEAWLVDPLPGLDSQLELSLSES